MQKYRLNEQGVDIYKNHKGDYQELINIIPDKYDYLTLGANKDTANFYDFDGKLLNDRPLGMSEIWRYPYDKPTYDIDNIINNLEKLEKNYGKSI